MRSPSSGTSTVVPTAGIAPVSWNSRYPVVVDATATQPNDGCESGCTTAIGRLVTTDTGATEGSGSGAASTAGSARRRLGGSSLDHGRRLLKTRRERKDGCLGRGWLRRRRGPEGRLFEGRGLLRERARELELADRPLGDERLADPLAGLALTRERLLELLRRDEATLDEDVPQPSPGLVHRRIDVPARTAELGPLLGDDARELVPRDAETLDEDLAELLPGLALDLERDPDLALREKASLDEHRADQAGGKGLGDVHPFHIGRPSFEL